MATKTDTTTDSIDEWITALKAPGRMAVVTGIVSAQLMALGALSSANEPLAEELGRALLISVGPLDISALSVLFFTLILWASSPLILGIWNGFRENREEPPGKPQETSKMATQSDSPDGAENSSQDDEPTLEEVHDTVRTMRVEVLSAVLILGGYSIFFTSAGQLMTEAWVVSAGVGLIASLIGVLFSEGHHGNGLCQRTFDLLRRAVRQEPIEWYTDLEDNERN